MLRKWLNGALRDAQFSYASEISLNSHWEMTTQPWKGQKQLELSVITGGRVNGSDHFGTSFDVICRDLKQGAMLPFDVCPLKVNVQLTVTDGAFHMLKSYQVGLLSL